MSRLGPELTKLNHRGKYAVLFGACEPPGLGLPREDIGQDRNQHRAASDSRPGEIPWLDYQGCSEPQHHQPRHEPENTFFRFADILGALYHDKGGVLIDQGRNEEAHTEIAAFAVLRYFVEKLSFIDGGVTV